MRVPPSGTWERRRADRLALAESWVGPDDATEGEGLAHLVRAYLRAFGPAAWRDVASWAGIRATDAKAAPQGSTLVRFRDEAGRELVDLPDAPLPDPDEPAPVRFLPHWDANLLVHARRTGLLPEAYRPRVFSTKNPFSVGTVLVDGRVVAAAGPCAMAGSCSIRTRTSPRGSPARSSASAKRSRRSTPSGGGGASQTQCDRSGVTGRSQRAGTP